MSEPTKKMFGGKQAALAFGSGLVGVSVALFRQYHTNGKISPTDIGASVFTFALLSVIVVMVARIANRPEK